MGLGSFRNRILFIVLIFLLWQSSKFWYPFTKNTSDTNKVSLGDDLQESNQRIPNQNQRILVTVFYEALCPDSRSFFVKQLLPTFERISEHMDVEPIPYGKAKTIKTKDGYTFECQHGLVECEANMIHACAIDTIKDQKQQLEFLTCMIKENYIPQKIMLTCAYDMGIDSRSIFECYNGKEGKGKDLLATYGKITEQNWKHIIFIPTISLNKKFDNQSEILKNLLKQVCLLFTEKPKGCSE